MHGLMVDGLVDGGLDEWMDGGFGRWMDGWMGAWIDGLHTTSFRWSGVITRAPKSPFLGSKITIAGDCSHGIERCLLLESKVITKLDSILKSRDITLLSKIHLVKAMVFPVVMYGCKSWTIKKADCQRIDAFELWCWKRLLRVPCSARKSNQSILKEISPEYSLEGLMLKLKLQYFVHLI